MRFEQFSITVPGQKTGPAVLTLYQIDNISVARAKKRPFVIVCGGGGYWQISDREKEPILLQFLAMGCSACLLQYSVKPNVFPTAVQELASAVALARSHAEEWNIDPDKIITCGFSAGGHLAASLGVFWNRDFVYGPLGLAAEDGKPNGQILCYPVISSGPKAHRGSIEKLLGERIGEPGLLELVSLENQVTGDTPKTFLWHTLPDQHVPVENSLLFAQALTEAGVDYELHIYPVGGHGLSLAGEETAGIQELLLQPYCSSWISMVKAWMELNFQCLSMKQ
ncbi:MAG: alpha/beta hydrolase [Lachnospiraceae bacterium]|nr:alpha/beta hydrolase [Lachnospiraceae bacterium]MDO5551162.1 alpha/beta hydrolase [Lachnospiraceae bacterium]